MRRLSAALLTAAAVLLATASPAAADVRKLVIKDPGYVASYSCTFGATACTSVAPSTLAIIHLVIKCPSGESFTTFVRVKQDGAEGTAQEGGSCTGDAEDVNVEVYPSSGSFFPGTARVKASAGSGEASPTGTGSFGITTDRRITLVEGDPGYT